MFLNYLIISFVIINTISLSHCERLHEQIYSSIEGGAACFRRLNGTHQVGCSSSDKGAVGVVLMIRDITDAQWLVHNATAGPYMAVVSTALFSDVVELLMSFPDHVAGVLLYDNGTASSFSQESKCPNEYSSDHHSQCSSTEMKNVWNEPGTGLLRRDIPYPIYYLSQNRIEEINKIEQCHDRYNVDRSNQNGSPLCSVQLSTFMYAAVSSVVCLRRSAISAASALLTPTKVCDPLGNQNVYYSLFPRNQEKNDTKKPVTLVTARIDTASLFDGVSPAAASSVVGMATLITTATLLSQLIPGSDANLYDENVLWTLFNGESFDYIGSQRVAYDISRNAWPPVAPLSPDDIKLHVEVGQIGGALHGQGNGSWSLQALVPYPNIPLPITEFVAEMSNNINKIPNNLGVTLTLGENLPPSSLHSFRRILSNATESGKMPAMLLVDHEHTFSNKFYQSVLDGFDKIDYVYHNISISNNGTFMTTEELLANGTMKDIEPQVKISRLATVLALTLYQQVAKKPYEGNVTASAHLVDEMLYCFLRSQACRLLIAADYGQSGGGGESLAEQPAPLYVGVGAWPGTAAVFAGHLLALLTGTHLPDDKPACDARNQVGYAFYWLKGWNNSGVCIQTTMNFTQAVSPAFVIPDYDFASGQYSTWTESVWQAMWARVFVSSGGGGARAAGVAGALATFLAALTTYWLQRHAAVLFETGSVNTDATTGILRTVNC